MGVRIVFRDREPVGQALRRLKQQLALHGVFWEMRRRRSVSDPTQARRAKRFQKRLKARKATLLKQQAGEQPVGSLPEAWETFRKRSGKP